MSIDKSEHHNDCGTVDELSREELHDYIIKLEERIEEIEASLSNDSHEAPVPDQRDSPIDDSSRTRAKDVIASIDGAREDGVELGVVIERLADEGYGDPDERVENLRRRGEIYNPREEIIKVV